MTQIVGFHGKKQSGKNTACNFLTMIKLIENGVCKSANINKEGNIEVTDIFGETTNKGKFLFTKPYIQTDILLENLHEVKIYAFADALKRIAIDVMGLPEKKVYGTNEDKEELTQFKWQDMPGVVTNKRTYDTLVANYPAVKRTMVYHQKGDMTIRDMLQFMGTEIFRRMYPGVWVDCLINKIEKEGYRLALICDVRFENEIKVIQNSNGIVVGLTKDVFKSKDNHASEKTYFNLCNSVIDNEDMNIASQNKAIYEALQELNCKYLPKMAA